MKNIPTRDNVSSWLSVRLWAYKFFRIFYLWTCFSYKLEQFVVVADRNSRDVCLELYMQVKNGVNVERITKGKGAQRILLLSVRRTTMLVQLKSFLRCDSSGFERNQR